MSTEWPILQQALARGREAVCAHMSVADVIGLTWKEETITDLLVCAVSPSVKAITFTRHEEKKTGADWLWWFLDPDGISFGMLVQAKRLKIKDKSHAMVIRLRLRQGLPTINPDAKRAPPGSSTGIWALPWHARISRAFRN